VQFFPVVRAPSYAEKWKRISNLPRNGSGVYSLPAGSTFNPNTLAQSAVVNSIKANTFSIDGIVSKKGWEQAVSLRKELGDLKADAPYTNYVITDFAERSRKLK